jgi:hypothetical protein
VDQRLSETDPGLDEDAVVLDQVVADREVVRMTRRPCERSSCCA